MPSPTIDDLNLFISNLSHQAHAIAAVVGHLVADRKLDADALNNVAGLHRHLRALTRAAEKGERA